MAQNHPILGHFHLKMTCFGPKSLKNHTIAEIHFITLAPFAGTDTILKTKTVF